MGYKIYIFYSNVQKLICFDSNKRIVSQDNHEMIVVW